MKKHNRIVALLLAALMSAAALISCSDTGVDAGTDDAGAADTTAPVETTTAETEEVPDTDDLPADLVYDGYTFRINSRVQGWFHGNYIIDEDKVSSRFSESIYDRRVALEERFKIKMEEVTGGNTDAARLAILANSHDYDMINTRVAVAWGYAEEGLLLSVDQLPNINLEKNYWDSFLNDAISMNGKLYFPTGAANVTAYDYTHCLLFNKDMAESAQLGNLYDIVTSGKWTLDKFEEVILGVSNDVDGDGAMTDADTYGFIAQPKAIPSNLWISSDILSVERDEKGLPVYDLASNQKFIDLIERAFALSFDSGAWYVNQSRANNDPLLVNMFSANKALFYNATFYYIEQLRTMETDFGIIPFPKYDEAQDTYLSRMEGVELSCVPITTPDAERASAIIEAMNSESVKEGGVLDTYYEITLQGQAARDEESTEMLDLIFDTRVFDLGDTIWCGVLRDGVFETMFLNNDRNTVSNLAKAEGAIKEAMDKTIKSFTGTN